MFSNRSVFSIAATVGALVLSGCAAIVDDEPGHGYDVSGDWDADAAVLTLEPTTDVNPVATQHVMVATVTNADGQPLGGRRVEWMLSDGVGAIVDIDKDGVYTSEGSLSTAGRSRDELGYKVDNTFAVSHTAEYDYTLDMGTSDPSDDMLVRRGQTWCAITATIEGTTNVLAYAPGIADWNEHKKLAHKHWMDVDWEWPATATNKVGTPHGLTTMVSRHSDGSALVGYLVTYEITGGPAAGFAPDGAQSATVETDGSGMAAVTLMQAEPAAGTNTIDVSIVRAGNDACCEPEKFISAGTTTKTWIAPGIEINKSAPAEAMGGEVFSYDITVRNTSDVDVADVSVDDTLPDGIEYVDSNPTAQRSGQSLSWTLGSMAPGARRSITVDVRGTRTGTFENCATVDAELGLTDEDCATTVIVSPALALEKSCTPEALVCDPITYTYTVRNTGDGPATSVRIRDQLAAGLALQGGGRNVDIDVGTLGPGESRDFTVDIDASQTGTYASTARATGDGGLQDEATCSTTVREPVLTIAKTGPATSFTGRNVTYQITVTNTGDAPATDAAIVDTLPAGTTFRSATNNGANTGSTVRWDLGDLAPGASRTVGLTLMSTSVGSKTNRATVSADCADDASDQATTEFQGIPAILLEVVDLTDPVEVGSNTTYRIRVTNQGTAVDTDIVITATLPAEVSFLSARGPTAETVSGRDVTFGALPSLAPGAARDWFVEVQADAVGDVRFAVAMTSSRLTSSVNETEATNLY